MSKSTSPRIGKLALFGLVAVASIELAAAAGAYRSQIEASDWLAVRERIDDQLPLLIDPSWLAPAARQHLPAARTDFSVGLPDLWGVARWQVLSPRDHAKWSRDLQDDHRGLPEATIVSRQDLGGLALTTYEMAPEQAPDRIVDSLIAHTDNLELHARTDGRRVDCRRSNSEWKCGKKAFQLARARVKPVEVDFRARVCLAIELRDGARLEIRIPNMVVGTTLRGHVGFGDFNARLRNDAPLAVEMAIDDSSTFRRVFADDEGWAAFTLETKPTTADVVISVASPTAGTWWRGTYREGTKRQACIELRSLGDATP